MDMYALKQPSQSFVYIEWFGWIREGAQNEVPGY